MAMTNAERKANYVERLKNNPEKYAEYLSRASFYTVTWLERDENKRFKEMLSNYSRIDRKAGREFNLTMGWCRENLFDKECDYCGTKELVGVDRLDNSIGHTIVNSHPVCKKCNAIRNRHRTHEEMLEFRKLVDSIGFEEARLKFLYTEEQKKQQRLAYRLANKEKRKAYSKKFREENKEKIKLEKKLYQENSREKIKLYREKTKEARKLYMAEYRLKNAERAKEVKKAWDEKNKEHVLEYRIKNKVATDLKRKEKRMGNIEEAKRKEKEYRDKNKEILKEYHTKWCMENKAKKDSIIVDKPIETLKID